MLKYKNIAIIADNSEGAERGLVQLRNKFGFTIFQKEKALEYDLILVLGGDGFMLRCLHSYMNLKIPFYGINCGAVGFLMNPLNIDNLENNINLAFLTKIHPLKIEAELVNGEKKGYLAINEVSLLRKTSQAAKLKVMVDGEVRINELVCDGILLATPAGSSAYNSSVNGPILPIGSNILALTPISPFRPKRWGGAILPNSVFVEIEVLDIYKRSVGAVADFIDIGNIKTIKIEENKDQDIGLLFNNDHSLEERIIKEQF